jgi:hypothetical protein
VEVVSVPELDEVLSEVEGVAARQTHPYVVTVTPADGLGPLPQGIQIGVGHPERSFVLWHGVDGGYGYQPELEQGPAGLRFDQGGQPIYPEPDDLRVLPSRAREAAREYVRTGKRPVCVQWSG